ncbi:hypothetical protein FA15DRAFT_403817 [Coprinopsis marcescibilis]|uniref:Uncharacterized protein n=1 Tax=Coprinopsis marcescibilis TaxID=230819 RepID=A0A5C3KWN5_COPMA|nr:hypothetical protein FA15DRAFT_403817 [Coprinopsis marcescibilis]
MCRRTLEDESISQELYSQKDGHFGAFPNCPMKSGMIRTPKCIWVWLRGRRSRIRWKVKSIQSGSVSSRSKGRGEVKLYRSGGEWREVVNSNLIDDHEH